MKRLTYIVVILALIYSGYWFVGARAVENGAKSQLAQMSDDGWSISYDALETRGFPSRFDTTVSDLNISAPDQSVGYASEIIQVLALSYQPNKAIVAFPPTQMMILDGLPITVNSDGLRASLGLKANTALSLDQVTAEATSVAFLLDQATLSSLNSLIASVRENSTQPNSYDTYFTFSDILWPQLILGSLPMTAGLPDTISNATFDAAVTLDKPLDRHTLPEWQAEPGKLMGMELRSFSMNWGAFLISASGAFTVDQDGIPDGTITLTINDWKGLLDIAQSTGLMPAQLQFMAQSMGQTLSQGERELVLPITVQNGNLSVGTFPLGPAPRLH